MQFILIGRLFVLQGAAMAGQIVQRGLKKNSEKLRLVKGRASAWRRNGRRRAPILRIAGG